MHEHPVHVTTSEIKTWEKLPNGDYRFTHRFKRQIPKLEEDWTKEEQENKKKGWYQHGYGPRIEIEPEILSEIDIPASMLAAIVKEGLDA